MIYHLWQDGPCFKLCGTPLEPADLFIQAVCYDSYEGCFIGVSLDFSFVSPVCLDCVDYYQKKNELLSLC